MQVSTDASGVSQSAAHDARPAPPRDIEEELLLLLWLYKNKYK